MDLPTIGQRVYVRPSDPAVPVQRGDGLYGQMIAPEGQECVWDHFLSQRLAEGSISLRPLRPPPDQRNNDMTNGRGDVPGVK